MPNILDHPILLFLVSLVVLTFSASGGRLVRKKHPLPEGEAVEGFGMVVNTTLTLLALLIGFTFSMALTRYDQRKNYEEAEANAIGTEYVRAELLPPADAAIVRTLLRSYTDQRILFYTIRDRHKLRQIDGQTAKLQAALWAAVKGPAIAKQTPVTALVASGMNDVLNSQGYTQAAWWNRIPEAAWILMAAMGICGTALVGYGARTVAGKIRLLWVLPLMVSIAFYLIADIDSPRHGIILVQPHNLQSLAASLQTP